MGGWLCLSTRGMTILRFARSKITSPCHSKKRSDEESAFPENNRRSRFLAALGMAGKEFHLQWWAEGPCNTQGRFLAMSFHGRDPDRSGRAATVVAGQALRVVEGRLVLRVLMGIVAGKTTDPAIAGAEAAAFSQPIGLKASGHGSLEVKRLHVRSGAVAGATELHEVSGGQGSGIEDVRRAQHTGLYRRHVLRPRAVAAFTGDTWSQLIEFQTAVAHGGRGVAAETSPKLLRLHRAPEGILQRRGRSWRVPESNIQTLDPVIESNSALVIGPVIREEVGLSDFADAKSEGPGDRQRNGVGTVRHRVDDPAFLSLDRVAVRSVAER